MKTLSQLIEQYGPPQAVIDHWDKHSKRFAIWGFEDTFSFSAGDTHADPLILWQSKLNDWKKETVHPDVSAIGGFAYDLKNYLFPHRKYRPYSGTTPLIWFGKPARVLEFKLEDEFQPESLNACIKLISDIPSESIYADDLKVIKEHLEFGNIYQINYTHPKTFEIGNDSFNIYMALRKVSHPPYGLYLNMGSQQILSASPERFFCTRSGTITTHPIKGTRPRSHNPIEDDAMATELYHSTKDRAEHLMIVDLLRNDLGKVCLYGSVKTHNLYKIESFETVHHMVTDISGKLQQNINESDIIRALFPGGSITGAPKESAMDVIDEVEDYSRGIYTGALGYIGSDGDMDFNIAIRTLTVENGKGVYPVGGGIVWDSDPKLEWEEAHYKGRILDILSQKLTNQKTHV